MIPKFVKNDEYEIKKITNFDECFTFVKNVGKGGFCKMDVYEFNKKLFALKFIKLKKKKIKLCLKNFKREFCIHKSVNLIVKNSPKLHDHFILERDNKTYLVFLMQYIEGSNFFGKTLEEKEIDKFVLWLAKTILILHNNNISHGDIKPGNIMMSNDNYYIVDFGVSSYLDDNLNLKVGMGLCGTKMYLSPQNINFSKNKIKYDVRYNDIWSMGVTLFTLLEGRHPWKNKDVCVDITCENYKIPFKKCSQFYIDLISSMLKHDINERISLEDVIEKIENKIASQE